MFDDYVGTRFEWNGFAERRFDLARDVEVVEDRGAVFIQLYDILAFRWDQIDVFWYLAEDFLVVDMDAFERGAEHISQHPDYSAFLLED